ncbi:30S ribosomal protein S3 [Geodia barretti]|uniref:Small ribosomal subunit protein uS3c n=1 Tax=Geodia barretti TaxID=519541 RepID=A0AA35TDK4_GEOBA|nr:30S ribosomal protein S3 [Geodia barretti]
MGHKTHPYGFRLGIIKDWKAHWYASTGSAYRNLVKEDLDLRSCIRNEYRMFSDAGIANVVIDRGAQDSVIDIHSARPGILIGRDGERVKNLRSKLEAITRSRVQLNIREIEQPEINAYLVARNVADQLERRVAYRRAMRQAAQRAMQAGAQGIKIIVKGRISGSEIARTEKLMLGQVPLHTLRANIDYAIAEAHTIMGRVGAKVWVYTGEVMPVRAEEAAELENIEVTVQADGPDIDIEALIDANQE